MRNTGFYTNQAVLSPNELYKKNLEFVKYLFAGCDDSKSYYNKSLQEIAVQITLSEISIHVILLDFEKIECPQKGTTYETKNGSIEVLNMVSTYEKKWHLDYINHSSDSKIEKASIIINIDGSYEYDLDYKTKDKSFDSIKVANHGVRIITGELGVSFDKYNKHVRKTRKNAPRDKTSRDTNELLKNVYNYGKRTRQGEKLHLMHLMN